MPDNRSPSENPVRYGDGMAKRVDGGRPWKGTAARPCAALPSADRLQRILLDHFQDRAQTLQQIAQRRRRRMHPAKLPDKSRFVGFRRASLKGHGSSGIFDFLGFTHLWGRSRKGFNVVRQVTAKDRFARAVKSVFDWCKRHRHLPLPDQWEHLAHAIRGHCSSYGLTGNGKRLGGFRYEVIRAWRKWLARRSRSGPLTWERMNALLIKHPLPPAKVVHTIYAS